MFLKANGIFKAGHRVSNWKDKHWRLSAKSEENKARLITTDWHTLDNSLKGDRPTTSEMDTLGSEMREWKLPGGYWIEPDKLEEGGQN
jgi:hypothetical protein